MSQCKRCGECCEAGGPTLHLDDLALFKDGPLDHGHVYTIRRGEMIREQIKGMLTPLHDELIKIKGADGGWTCVFFDSEAKACTIYENRPQECKAQDCSDISAIVDIYDKDRLSRSDVLADRPGLLELIEEHEKRCSPDRLRTLVSTMQTAQGGQLEAVKREIEAILRYDASIRQAFLEKAGVAPDVLEFLFGRALSDTLHQFGMDEAEAEQAE